MVESLIKQGLISQSVDIGDISNKGDDMNKDQSIEKLLESFKPITEGIKEHINEFGYPVGLKNSDFGDKVKANGYVFKLKNVVELNVPSEDEIGQSIQTQSFKFDGNSKAFKVGEMTNTTITSSDLIVRAKVHNTDEYYYMVVPSEQVRNDYGDEVIGQILGKDGFTEITKEISFTAALVTQELVDDITRSSGSDVLKIRKGNPYNGELLVAKIGDFVTEEGNVVDGKDVSVDNLLRPFEFLPEKIKEYLDYNKRNNIESPSMPGSNR